jgi:hypothetical protein
MTLKLDFLLPSSQPIILSLLSYLEVIFSIFSQKSSTVKKNKGSKCTKIKVLGTIIKKIKF